MQRSRGRRQPMTGGSIALLARTHARTEKRAAGGSSAACAACARLAGPACVSTRRSRLRAHPQPHTHAFSASAETGTAFEALMAGVACMLQQGTGTPKPLRWLRWRWSECRFTRWVGEVDALHRPSGAHISRRRRTRGSWRGRCSCWSRGSGGPAERGARRQASGYGWIHTATRPLRAHAAWQVACGTRSAASHGRRRQAGMAGRHLYGPGRYATPCQGGGGAEALGACTHARMPAP